MPRNPSNVYLGESIVIGEVLEITLRERPGALPRCRNEMSMNQVGDRFCSIDHLPCLKGCLRRSLLRSSDFLRASGYPQYTAKGATTMTGRLHVECFVRATSALSVMLYFIGKL